MIRVIRTETLRVLQAAAGEIGRLQRSLDEEAAKAVAARKDAGRFLDELGRERTAREQAEREREEQFEGLLAVIRQVTAERDSARTALEAGTEGMAETIAEMHADLDRIRADAADPERGTAVKGAIALGALRHLYAQARSQGIEPGGAFDLLAVILGLGEEAPPQIPGSRVALAGSEANGGRE
jgi:hypothetical protein